MRSLRRSISAAVAVSNPFLASSMPLRAAASYNSCSASTRRTLVKTTRKREKVRSRLREREGKIEERTSERKNKKKTTWRKQTHMHTHIAEGCVCVCEVSVCMCVCVRVNAFVKSIFDVHSNVLVPKGDASSCPSHTFTASSASTVRESCWSWSPPSATTAPSLRSPAPKYQSSSGGIALGRGSEVDVGGGSY